MSNSNDHTTMKFVLNQQIINNITEFRGFTASVGKTINESILPVVKIII